MDLTLELPLDASAISDKLADTIDYGELGELVIEIGTKARFHLLEALAAAMAARIQSRWPDAAVTVAIRKASPPVAFAVQSIEVRIHREPVRR